MVMSAHWTPMLGVFRGVSRYLICVTCTGVWDTANAPLALKPQAKSNPNRPLNYTVEEPGELDTHLGQTGNFYKANTSAQCGKLQSQRKHKGQLL